MILDEYKLVQKRLADFLIDVVEQGPQCDTYYQGAARDIINMILDAGQYVTQFTLEDSLETRVNALESRVSQLEAK